MALDPYYSQHLATILRRVPAGMTPHLEFGVGRKGSRWYVEERQTSYRIWTNRDGATLSASTAERIANGLKVTVKAQREASKLAA